METKQYTYFAFISYKREDERWAKWLQRKLENYRLPSVIRKASENELPKNLRPIFRDKTDLSVGGLKESLVRCLQESKCLIVICSPNSAKSEWVGQEISAFIDQHREKQIIPFVVDGSLNYDDAENCCLNPVFQRIADELLCVDVREVGKEKAFVRVVSGLLGLSFDELWQRHRRHKIRRNILIAVFSALLVAGALYALRISKPFNASVQLLQTVENDSLPIPEKGMLILSYGQKSDTAVFPTPGTVSFAEIPGRYNGEMVRLHFQMYGFKTVDTSMLLGENMVLPISRDNSYSVVKGIVENTDGRPLSGVELRVPGYKSVTDSTGAFAIEIPIADQRAEYQIEVWRNGVNVLTQTVYPLSDCLLIIE